MSSRFRALPQVPTNLDPQTRAFLSALKENIEVLAGMRGDSNIVEQLLGYKPAKADRDAIIDLIGFEPEEAFADPWPSFLVTSVPYPTYDQACTVDRTIGYTTANNTVVTNSGGHFSTGNGRFTAPVAGLYSFTSTFSRSAGHAGTSISKNGVRISADSLSYGTDWQTGAATATIELAVGDYVTATAAVENGTSVAHYSSSFSGHLIRKT